MDDLISRQAAIDATWEEPTYTDPINVLTEVRDRIKKLPSAQPEIIRCKDCKHQPFDSEDMRGFGVEFPDEMCPCQCDDGWYNWRPDNEWYCANAERRTDE